MPAQKILDRTTNGTDAPVWFHQYISVFFEGTFGPGRVQLAIARAEAGPFVDIGSLVSAPSHVRFEIEGEYWVRATVTLADGTTNVQAYAQVS